jgi:Asp-tRNA(Asn)/Glu-tRNA(Gln) amidotransferase C subunit
MVMLDKAKQEISPKGELCSSDRQSLKLDENSFSRLTELSKFKLDFSQEKQLQLNDIFKFVGKVTEYGGEYDIVAENRQVPYSALREDTVIPTATPEQLLANTNFDNNCYIIPRVID